MQDNEFEFDLGESYLGFSRGWIAFGAYSYHIGSYGHGELSPLETRNLYEAMKNYYEGDGVGKE